MRRARRDRRLGAGHFPTDDFGLGCFDGTQLYEHADPRQGFHPEWDTLVFNLGRTEVANILLANALFWLREISRRRPARRCGRVDALSRLQPRKPGEWIPNNYGGSENLEADRVSCARFNEVVYGDVPGVMTIAEESTAWPACRRPT